MKLSYPSDSPSCSYFGFSSSFSFFLIQGDGKDGQGFTFAVVLDSTLGAGGSQLGYGGGTGLGFAIEFDTYADPWDPQYKHIGINIGRTVVSTVTQPASFLYDYGWGLKYAWVDLDPVSHTLSVFVSKSNSKPDSAILSTYIDLCNVLGLPSNSTLPPLYAGFTSSANDAAYGTQAVFDWSMTTRELLIGARGTFSYTFLCPNVRFKTDQMCPLSSDLLLSLSSSVFLSPTLPLSPSVPPSLSFPPSLALPPSIPPLLSFPCFLSPSLSFSTFLSPSF